MLRVLQVPPSPVQ